MSSKPSNLAASLLSTRTAPAAGSEEDKRYLSGVVATEDHSQRDRQYLAASVEVVLLMIGECLTAAAASLLSTPLPKTAKGVVIDPERVTLKTDGSKVRANLPVAYSLADGSSRWMNFTVTVPSGEVENYLRPFCQRVSK